MERDLTHTEVRKRNDLLAKKRKKIEGNEPEDDEVCPNRTMLVSDCARFTELEKLIGNLKE